METKRIGSFAQKTQPFLQSVRQAKNGDKKSMEEIVAFFKEDIEYLSRFIMLPREETIQALKIELLTIVSEQL